MSRLQLRALALVVLFGCGSEVIQTDDGGGGSGLGPSQGGSDPTTNAGGGPPTNGGGSSVGGAPPTTNNGGSGGAIPGTPCEQVCSNVETCFGVSCETAGLDCNNPQFDCPAECLQNASCDELVATFNQNPPPEIAACIGECQGGEGGAGGGPPQQGCVQCLFQNQCLQPCMNQPGCQGWAPCAQNCQDPSCFADCNAQFPEAEPFFSQIYECACANCEGCDAPMDPCNQGAGGSAGSGGGG